MNTLKEIQNEIDSLQQNKGELSDGYHTFNQLYEFRHILFIQLVKFKKEIAFKTFKNKEGEKWEGWFILGLNTNLGQITFHLPIEYWNDLNDIKEIESNFNYDGHNSDDVLNRLRCL